MKKTATPVPVNGMILYHGTGEYAIAGIRAKGLELKDRPYINRKAACTTRSIGVARRFAFRKSSSEDFIKGRFSGVVLEFVLNGTTAQFSQVKDPQCSQNEFEVAVFDPSCLTLVAIHRYEKNDWLNYPYDKRRGFPATSGVRITPRSASGVDSITPFV